MATPSNSEPQTDYHIQIDLKPMQQLALTDSYHNILAPQVAGNLATTDYDGLVTLSKVIYPN